MNKKTKKLKKQIKRSLRDIGFKKSCKTLKNNFLSVFKTAIYDSSYFNENENPSYFHPVWGNLQQPLIEEIENGYILENSGGFLPLNITEATERIFIYKKYGEKICVTVFNFQDMEENWIVI